MAIRKLRNRLKNKVVKKNDPIESPNTKLNTRLNSGDDTVVKVSQGFNQFKKLDDIVNKYPAKRGEDVTPFYIKKSSTQIEHTAGNSVNTINQKGTLRNVRDLIYPNRFGEVPPLQKLTLVDTNFSGNPTRFRFFLKMDLATYVSVGLKNDLMTARAEGNPYFTPHLIPTVTVSQFNLKQLLTEFNAKESIWGFQIVNSLGTETGPTGEIEIVKYIDSLLYDDPIGSDNEFQLPYRRGTIIASHLFSQNPPGFGESNTDDLDASISTGTDDASLANLFNQSSVGQGTALGQSTGETTSESTTTTTSGDSSSSSSGTSTTTTTTTSVGSSTSTGNSQGDRTDDNDDNGYLDFLRDLEDLRDRY